jgi:hypothetical protein
MEAAVAIGFLAASADSAQAGALACRERPIPARCGTLAGFSNAFASLSSIQQRLELVDDIAVGLRRRICR